MIEMFSQLEPMLKTFWLIAICASLIFILQTILAFAGADTDVSHDGDMSFHGDSHGLDHPFQLFSFRNLINFLLGFSWAGISFYSSVGNFWMLLGLAFLVGFTFVFVFFLIIRQIRKLEEDNTYQLSEALQQQAEVYLPIPPKREGKGKIMLSIRGSYKELEAITDGEKRIPTGALVRVVGVDNTLLLVETI